MFTQRHVHGGRPANRTMTVAVLVDGTGLRVP
jgi:hypothetical protein